MQGKGTKLNLCYFIWGRPCYAKECLNKEKFSVFLINDSYGKKLKEQLLSNNTSWLAQEDLKKLKQDKLVREYVKEFSSLILDNEKNLFNFLLWHQPWTQAKLWRQHVKDLSFIIVVADGLIDFKATTRNILQTKGSLIS